MEPTPDRLEGPLEFERLISDLSSRFVLLSADGVDGAIEDALRRVCEVLHIDLAVLWQWSAAEPAVIAPTHAYCVRPELRPSEPMRQEDYPWTRRQMLSGNPVNVASLDDLPVEAAVDRETCRRFGIRSALCLPLSVGGERPIGALGFNALRSEYEWPDPVAKRLHLVAQVFANALVRSRHERSVRENEERLKLAADAAEAGLWTLDFGTGVFWATERARAIFGYTADEVIPMARFEASVHPDDLGRVRAALERCQSSREPLDVEYRILLPDEHHVRWIASRGRPQLTSSGEPNRLTGVSIDATDRKRAESALRRSEARLESASDLAGLGFYEIDYARGVVYADERFCELCGVPSDQREGMEIFEQWMRRVHPDDLPGVLDLRRRLHDGELERISSEYRFRHPARGETWIDHLARVARRDAAGSVVATFGVLRDVSDRKRAEEELHDLSQRLIRAHEEERALLARELHDDLTQRLAVLAIDVGLLEIAAPRGALADSMRAIREELARLSEDVHALAYQLHPSILEELGLAEALRAECERVGRRGRVELSLEIDPLPEGVGKETALCLFRVAQEALNNVVRHAGARSARVVVRRRDGGLVLSVRDDGTGFDPEGPGRRRSLGLAGMRERVRLVEGTLDVESEPGRGTAVVVWVPAPEEAR